MMNRLFVAGTVSSEPEFSYELHGNKFYKFVFTVKRESGNEDTMNCIAPEKLMPSIVFGEKISFVGEIQTRNLIEEEKRKLIIYVRVKEIFKYPGNDENLLSMDCFLCKKANYRKTPFGRKISDLIVASNREFQNISDYIPCIAWGRNALNSTMLDVGARLCVSGRFQSRLYKKVTDYGEETRTAYEVSITTYVEIEKDGFYEKM